MRNWTVTRRIRLRNASTSLWTLTGAQLRNQVASVEPTPGGGSVAIVTATLGVASIHKGVVVSLKKSSTSPARHQSLLELRSKASALIASLSGLADADSHAFANYLEACALPRATDSERTLRHTAREVGLVRATKIPLEAAEVMGRGVEFAEAAARIVDAHVRTEVLTGGILLRASIKSLLLTVDANLSGISDGEIRDALKRQQSELESAFVHPG
jgi:methenyltetrahydrofolate cyclohydrolase